MSIGRLMLMMLYPKISLNALAVYFSGAIIEHCASVQLGVYYTRKLKVVQNQKLVDRGLYAYIRNPGSIGSIIEMLGQVLLMDIRVVFAVMIMFLFVANVHRRVVAEEELLRVGLDGYENYMSKTWRYLPLL